MSTLAIYGGSPVRTKPFPSYKTMGGEEKQAVTSVIDSGVLSAYLGAWHEKFYGGEQVQALEKAWAEKFGVKHAIAVNSNTSGLIAAMGAIGIEPGDEVIVSPYSMTISAVAPLFYGAIPVFADIEDTYFCLDPQSVKAKITQRTKAIIVVDLFGHPYNADAINKIAKEHNLYVIEDAAQAPGGMYNGKFTGTLGDIGVFSLNYHKHIHCGEGGVIVTDNDKIAENLQLIRNHAESVVGAKEHHTLTNMIGYNFRMTEIEAAIASCQLKKLDNLLETRISNSNYLLDGLAKIPAISAAKTHPLAKHSFYVQVCTFDASIAGIDRNSFIEAVRAELPYTITREKEGKLVNYGYVKPIYLQPSFQQRIAFGSKGYPFTLAQNVSYDKGICPVVESMHFAKLFTIDLAHSFMSKQDLDDVIAAFTKVWENRHLLGAQNGKTTGVAV